MGAATEHHWLELFSRDLPRRYRATPAFIIDSSGRRSRQIDVAIFDNLYSPPLLQAQKPRELWKTSKVRALSRECQRASDGKAADPWGARAGGIECN